MLQPHQASRLRWWWAALAPVVVIAAAVVVIGNRSDEAPLPPGQVVSFVVPFGTADAIRAGDPEAAVLPERLELTVGDWLELVNEDVETHRLGPVVARAGETTRVRFFDAGAYQVECTVGHESVSIEVRSP
jgi:hypothetical protein